MPRMVASTDNHKCSGENSPQCRSCGLAIMLIDPSLVQKVKDGEVYKSVKKGMKIYWSALADDFRTLLLMHDGSALIFPRFTP